MIDLTPTQRLLGVGADDGPFELLGLERKPTPPEEITAAAKRRYDRFATGNFDPHDVIAAQEAVAAAEALLANPDVQRECLRLYDSPPPATAAKRTSTPNPAAHAPAVLAALASAGGWNQRAAVAIGAIALETGIPPALLVRSATATARPRLTPAAPVPHPAPQPASTPPTQTAPLPAIAGTLTAAAIAVLLTILVLTSVFILRAARSPVASTEPLSETALPAPTIDPILDLPLGTETTTIAALTDAMTAAHDLLKESPADAAWRMEEAVTAYAARWLDASPEDRARALLLVRSFLTDASSGSGAARRVASAVAQPFSEAAAGTPTPASLRALVWSAGAVAILTADPGIPEETIDALLAAAPAAPASRAFEAAARAALTQFATTHARSGTPLDQPVWDAWAQLLDDLTQGRALARQRQTMALDAIEGLLLSSATPSRSEASFHAAELLLPKIELNGARSTLSRERFLTWLDDPRVASIDLAILMRAARLPEFASRELAPSASAEARTALRKDLLAQWGMSPEPAPSERLAADWSAAQRAIDNLPAGTGLEALVRAVARARQLEAAYAAWHNEPLRAASELRLAPRVTVPAPRGAGKPPTPSSADGRWTVEYFSVRRNAELALEALDRSARLGHLGPIDSRTLARVAILGSPPQVRKRAQALASDRADEPRLLEAVLELLPRAPRTLQVAELIDTLTADRTGDPRDEDWPLRARRALTQRLALAIEPDDAPARAQRLAILLRDALAPAARYAGAPPQDAAAAAAETADALLKEATNLGVTSALDASETRRRRDGRRRVATGPIQRTVVEATAIAEALAALTSAERPASASKASTIIRDMNLIQRRADDAFTQLDAAMRSAADLWAIRLGYAQSTHASITALPLQALHPLVALGATDTPIDTRLARLDPSRPADYLTLAEEIAYEATNPDDVRLARRLALLAAHLARDDAANARVSASACLLLADLSTNEQRRQWLRALADGFGARDGLLRWRTDTRRDFAARLAAAEVLALVRAEENRRASELYKEHAVRQALQAYDHAIPGGISTLEHRMNHAPSCPECKNERVIRSATRTTDWVLCYTCAGYPSPRIDHADLVQYIRVERALLGDDLDWGVHLATHGAQPLRDLTLDEAAASYNIDLNSTVYTNGRWSSPAEPRP